MLRHFEVFLTEFALRRAVELRHFAAENVPVQRFILLQFGLKALDIADLRHIRVRIRVVADGVAFLCHTFYKLRLRLKIIADKEERCLYAVFFERVQNSLRVAVFKAGIKRDVDLFFVRVADIQRVEIS